MSKLTSRTMLLGHNRRLKIEKNLLIRDNRLKIQVKNQQLRQEKLKNLYLNFIERTFIWKVYLLFNKKLRRQLV